MNPRPPRDEDGPAIVPADPCAVAPRPIGWAPSVATWLRRRPWRRPGLGRALLVHAFREFHSRGFERVGLGVDASSLTGANRLYESAGMRVVRQTDFYEKAL